MKIFNDIYANTDKFIENTNISFLYSGDLVSRDDIKKMMVEPSNEDMFFCYSYNDSLDFSQLTKTPKKKTTKKAKNKSIISIKNLNTKLLEKNFKKVKMEVSDLGFKTNINFYEGKNILFYIQYKDKIDIYKDNFYKITLEKAPYSLSKIQYNILPKKITRFDYFREQLKSTVSKVFNTISRMADLTKQEVDTDEM